MCMGRGWETGLHASMEVSCLKCLIENGIPNDPLHFAYTLYNIELFPCYPQFSSDH